MMANDKQGLTLPEKVAAPTAPVILKVKGLRGKYGSAMFGDDFVSIQPVEPALAQEIMERFSGVKIVQPKELVAA